MNAPHRPDVVVVGAGLAGLAAATHLHRAGVSVVVLEQSDGVGGRVRTDHVDGFLLDRGFQVLLTAYPEAHRQLDLEALDLRRFDPGALVWLDRGYVVGDPFRQPSTLLPTVMAPIGSPADKLRILRLRRRVGKGHAALLLRGEELTTAEMLRREGFSQRVVERFFRPLFAGIQLDPTLTTSRRMFDIIFRSLGTGDATVPARGMQAIPDQLASQLPDGAVRLGHTVRSVEAQAVVLDDGTRVEARAVVTAVEGPAASALLGLPAVGSRPVACVYFAAPTAPVPHHLVVLDGSSRGPALNVAVMSNVAPSYAPPGHHLVACAVPGSVDGDLETTVRAQLRGWWGSQVDRWSHLRTYRIHHGQPDQSPPLHPKRTVTLPDGRFVCGDHRDTGSIQGALYSGRRCAEAVLSHLQEVTP
jgi:phytoene dehydrogenase-like protein